MIHLLRSPLNHFLISSKFTEGEKQPSSLATSKASRERERECTSCSIQQMRRDWGFKGRERDVSLSSAITNSWEQSARAPSFVLFPPPSASIPSASLSATPCNSLVLGRRPNSPLASGDPLLPTMKKDLNRVREREREGRKTTFGLGGVDIILYFMFTLD